MELPEGKFVASQMAVDQLLGTLEFATFERRVSRDAVEESELGLGAPITVVTIEMGPKTYKLAIGGEAPSPKDARYCEAEGGVFVITAQLAAALDVRPEAFRTRSFVPYLSTDLKGLWIDGEGGARRFARATWTGSRGAGFRFDGSGPEGEVRANAEAFDRVLGALGGLQAESFLADDEADAALKKRATMTLIPKDDRQPKAVIDVGGACPGKEDQIVAVRREPSRTSACVPESILEALLAPAKDFVDLSVVGTRPDEIAEIAITEGARAIEIARSGAGWHMRKPADRKVSLEAGNALADALTGAVAAKIVTGTAKDLGLDPPRATLKVTSSVPVFGAGAATAERVETIEIGAPQGDVVHVRRVEDGVFLEMAADKARALAPSEAVLRDAKVLDLPRDQVRGLAVQMVTPEGARTQRLSRGTTGWKLDEPAAPGLAADGGLVDDVLDALAGLEAVRWVADKDDGSFGLEKPRIVIELKVAEGEGAPAKTTRVELGAETTGGVFARTSADPAVFVAPVSVAEAVGVWLLDRQALVVDPPAIVRVEAAAPGGKRLIAERSGDAWKSASGDGDAVAATLRSTVSTLIAEGVVAMGPPDKSFGLDKPRLVLTVVVEPEQGAPKGSPRRTMKIAFGAGDSVHGTSIVYTRRDGLDATFAVALGRLRALFDAAGVK